jgi:hypothetical protein
VPVPASKGTNSGIIPEYSTIQGPQQAEGCSSAGPEDLQRTAPEPEENTAYPCEEQPADIAAPADVTAADDVTEPADVSAPEVTEEAGPSRAQPEGGNVQHRRVASPEHLEQAAALKVPHVKSLHSWLPIKKLFMICPGGQELKSESIAQK